MEVCSHNNRSDEHKTHKAISFFARRHVLRFEFRLLCAPLQQQQKRTKRERESKKLSKNSVSIGIGIGIVNGSRSFIRHCPQFTLIDIISVSDAKSFIFIFVLSTVENSTHETNADFLRLQTGKFL